MESFVWKQFHLGHFTLEMIFLYACVVLTECIITKCIITTVLACQLHRSIRIIIIIFFWQLPRRSQSMMSLNSSISNDDENLFLKEFYHIRYYKNRNYSNFENILIEWMKEFFDRSRNDERSWKKEKIGFRVYWNLGFFYEHDLVDANNTISKNNLLLIPLSRYP